MITLGSEASLNRLEILADHAGKGIRCLGLSLLLPFLFNQLLHVSLVIFANASFRGRCTEQMWRRCPTRPRRRTQLISTLLGDEGLSAGIDNTVQGEEALHFLHVTISNRSLHGDTWPSRSTSRLPLSAIHHLGCSDRHGVAMAFGGVAMVLEKSCCGA